MTRGMLQSMTTCITQLIMKARIGDLRAMLRCSGLGAKILLHELLALTHGG